jgi:hypothetical protein
MQRHVDREETRLLDAFVTRAGELPVVRQIWIGAGESLDMTVVVSEHDLLDELRVAAMFQELSASTSRPSCGELAFVVEPYEPGTNRQLLTR